ncbi:MAG: SUMF1/EgtB/PvdO family nonheme iron enzyme [Isosphaeraceae bacterium]
MFDPWQEPTEDRQGQKIGEETVNLDGLTEVADPCEPRPHELDLTVPDEGLITPAVPLDEPVPDRIGRYRVERRLGYGGFGSVYLAHDEQLDRRVAVKVPHARLVSSEEDAGLYLAEARAVAQLDHPNIVPVYDVGGAGRFPFYIVSKYIESETLAVRIRRDRPGWVETAELIATIAEALDHAHSRGLVHRDVKPGNILIGEGGTPFIVDPGWPCAADQGKGPRFVGTPAYMSPEQACGEGHRLDRRSDVFSLGVVLYELLCGMRPFRAPTRELLMIQMNGEDPRPPCQVDASIPLELQRICLKALARRAGDRYATAQAMAGDLRHFLGDIASAAEPPRPGAALPGRGAAPAGDTAFFLSHSFRVVPKGLRAFNERDADFFIELLPGPRDRDGLPEGLRFWKDWVEQSEPGPTSAVGLIYGPSGCGKTSLVKAGLLPRLDPRVLTVYVEATPLETESRLMAALRRRCPALPEGLGFKECLAALRRGRALPEGGKVLLVLDQFEQWLHARRGEEAPALVQDLRQCDGERVQCMVMVRDDFWMAATRFMRALEVPLLEGRNSASVDLFEPAHARRVLAAFGRAYGKLDDSRSRARERDAFLAEAVSGLAQEGKVVCVRLALFAEMMKTREWTRSALSQVGGARGVGFTFLEENFGLATSPPAHLHHEKAARAVLAALLPESGTDIKGHMRSESELRTVSGYSGRPEGFEKLIRILDSELRLITPTDPEGREFESAANGETDGGRSRSERFYQLTHDYLVHSVSDWLTRKQRESRRGRAELRLQERAQLWGPKPESRFLPSLGEWLGIELLTERRTWSKTQRAMMQSAGRRYGALAAFVACTLALVTWGAAEARAYFWASSLVTSLGTASTSEVPTIIRQLSGYRRWADPMLRSIVERTPPERREHLHASLALLPSDGGQADYVRERLTDVEAADLHVLREALAPYRERIVGQLWNVLGSGRPPRRSRVLPAAAALALYAPGDPRWGEHAEKVAHELVSESPVALASWLDLLRPVRERLIPPIAAIVRDSARPDNERVMATNVLVAYAAGHTELIADLIMDADPATFNTLLPLAQTMQPRVLALFREEIGRERPEPPADPAKAAEYQARCDRLAGRQARAAAALVRMNWIDEVVPLLAHSPDPRLRSNLILWLQPLGLGADPRSLVDRLDMPRRAASAPAAPPQRPGMDAILADRETSVRRAILLVLGQFELGPLSPDLAEQLVTSALTLYREDPDSGIHGAAAYALRRWGQEAKLRQADVELAARGIRSGFRWYVNRQGLTFAVVEGPVEFLMGSPPHEPDRQDIELPHRRVIPRRFAIATTEVTNAQFQAFLNETSPGERGKQNRYSTEPGDPVSSPSWYEAAAFCDWLSRKENLRPSYQAEPEAGYREGMKVPADVLLRGGYRLPTEAEWEYACRAGTTTGRYCGGSPAILDRFARYIMNSDGKAGRCGVLLPNDLGLFDTLGSLYEWCQDRFDTYRPGANGRVIDDGEGEFVVARGREHILRSSSFGDLASEMSAAHRIWNTPENQLGVYGFRVARTMP